MSGAQAQENHELKEEVRRLNEEVEDLADNNELLNKQMEELPLEDIEKFKDSARFITAVCAMLSRRDSQLKLANERVEKLESDLVDAYSKITDARDAALQSLQEMDNEKQIAAVNTVIDLLPDKAD